ncbi:hypothetical protein GQ457_09G001600 [Hibiscus cannabinus]
MVCSGFLFCSVIVAFDITAGVLGIAAQITDVKCQPALDVDLCGLVPFLLGLAALVLLVLAQVSGNCFAGCICICTKKDLDKASATKQLAAASHIFSWIILAVGWTVLIIGMTKIKSTSDHFFFIGGFVCFLHGFSSITYFLSATKAARDDQGSGFLVCSLIMALDITAGILGIAVQIMDKEGSRDSLDDVLAFMLGFVASVLLVLAQVSGNCFAGCIWICTKEDLDKASGKKKMAVASHIFSWIMLAVGLTMLIVGMAKFESATDHFLFVGGLVCFIHGLFTVAYIVSAIAAAREDLASGIQNPLERYLRS